MTNKKSPKKLIIVSVLAVMVLVVIIAAVFMGGNKKDNNSAQSRVENSSQTDVAELPSNQADEVSENPAQGSYIAYDPSKLSAVKDGQVVLFFNAKWCSTCQAANKNLTNNPVPAGLTIMSVDYDQNRELRKKYGVTIQHTFVQVDSNGNLIKKWVGSEDSDQIQAEVKKV